MVISTLESLSNYLNSFIYNLCRLKEYVRRQIGYYLIYNHLRLLHVVGLVFGRALTNYAIINVLAWYFTDHGEDLVASSIWSNLHDLLKSILVIFMAYSCVGRFHTLLFSNTAYIGGLIILWMFSLQDLKWLVVIMLVLLALGTSGDHLLQKLFVDLVNDIDKSQDRTKERSAARAAIWSHIANLAAAICTILWVAPGAAVWRVHSSWRSSFLICIVTMITFLIIFCIGDNIYHLLLKHKSRRINDSWRPDRPAHNLETEKVEVEGISQERSPRGIDTKRKEVSGNSSCKQEYAVIVKSLLRMLPMWVMYIVVSLISATGSTFFLQQYNNLNNPNNQIAVQSYDLIKDVSSFAIPIFYNWICGSHKNEKVKIGVGMLCGIVSCLFAWQLEVQRLQEVNNLQDKDANTSISFLWLVPQFCVLGCMEGLTGEGLLMFYWSQTKIEPLQSYGEEYIEFVKGIGIFLNIILIVIFKSQPGWFGDTINDSHLDKYYLFLVFLCLANFIIYCLIAKYYYKDADQHQDFVTADLNQGLELLACNNHEQGNQLLANDDQEQDNQLLASDGQKQDNQLLPKDDQEQEDQLSANDDQEQDNQLLADDDQEQDNQLLGNDDQEQDNNQLLASDGQKQDNQLLPNDDHEQEDQLLANDDQEQDNQLLPNDDQKEENHLDYR